MNRDPIRQPSSLTVLATAFTISGALIAVLIISILYGNFRNGLREELRNRLVTITSIAALQQDGDMLVKVAGRDDEYYQIINRRNLQIRLSDPDLIYVYTMRRNAQGIYFIVDANQPGDDGIADFGQPYLEPGPTLAENFDTLNETIIEPDFYTDEFGTFLSAYAPIFASNGERVGVLGVDIAADRVVEKEGSFLILSLVIFFATLPVIGLLGYLLGRLITDPLARLTSAAQSIAEGDLDRTAEVPAGSREAALLAVSFNTMTQKFNSLVNSLESEVAVRTEGLERRTAGLQAVASVARRIATIQDLDQLLTGITQLVSEQFDYYHTGIFLLDENHEFAVLRATNSEGGQRMLARQHELKVDSSSIVGYATSRGEPRIALDAETDSFFFNNPDLPDTRSEMALPLRVGDRIIGALDVQSTQPHAFSEEDIATLATLADQIAIAIENARLFSEARRSLTESEQAIARYIRQEWTDFARQARNTAYLFDGKRITPLDRKDSQIIGKSLPRTGRLTLDQAADKIVVPIRLRGQTIGFIDVKSRNIKRKWTQDDLTLLEAAAERAALALENSRLVDSAQRRATREQTIGEIATRIGAVSDMETIMQAAVEELGRRIGAAAEVTFELGSEL